MLNYVAVRSHVHALHPVTKMAWLLGFVILGSLSIDIRFLLALLGVLLLLAAWARVLSAVRGYGLAMLGIAGVVFLLQILFRREGEVLFTLFPRSLPLIGGSIPVTSGGVAFALAMSLRMLVFVMPVPILFATTQTRDIARAMVETLKVPRDYAFLLTTTLRFVPVIATELGIIAQAQRARGYVMEGWNPVRKLRAFAPIALPIVFIAIAKADRLSLSMQLRGFGSAEPTYARRLHFHASDAMALLILILGMFAAFWLVLFGTSPT